MTLLLAAAIGLGITCPSAFADDPDVTVTDSDTAITIAVSGEGSVPHSVVIAKDAFAVRLVRDGDTVLSTALNTEGLAAMRGGTRVTARQVLDSDFDGTRLQLHAAASDGGTPFTITATPAGDRTRWSATLPNATSVTLALDLAASGHWYGNGENVGGEQPWPLDTGLINNTDFSPSSYYMTEPFWFTSKATGIWVDTQQPMTVRIDGRSVAAATKRADLTVRSTDTLDAVTFVERTPRAVFQDYVGIAGKPEKSDAPDIQYTEPVWNTWAMYSSPVRQEDVVAYAQNIKANNLGGYAIQIDDRWSSKYGDNTFDPVKFPDPKEMSRQIHELGFDLGLWVTLWINLDAENYPFARDHGYLLRSAADPTQPCRVTWWNGTAGIVDLGNPEAREWYRDELRKLMSEYDVQGFKFDTRFFDDACMGTNGLTRRDYQRLGAELADEFDLQGVGIRTHWTGQQKYGFIMRSHDAAPNFGSTGLGWSMRQTLSVSMVGYPFVTSDMTGGSTSGNPTDEVLVRWAQASAVLPLFYASTSPAGPYTRTRVYTPQTLALYREAVDRHRTLAPYILDQVRRAVAEGEPIIKPLFFNYPDEEPTYTLNDEWLLGDAVLAAPVLVSATQRDIYVPTGTWYDVNTGARIQGPTTLTNYPAPISVSPLFVRLDHPEGPAVARALDTVAPELTLPDDIHVDSVNPTANVEYTVTATDGADPEPQVTCTPASGAAFPIGATTVECTATDAAGNTTSGSFTVTVRFTPQTEVGGVVPATLALSLGPPASFGAFVPGVAREYESSTTATVTSSAGDAQLSVADPSATATGHLVNGTFALPQPLRARASSPAGTGGAAADVGSAANPTALLSYDGPVSNDAVTITFLQAIGANDPLRTGDYAKTLTFTLSTTTP